MKTNGNDLEKRQKEKIKYWYEKMKQPLFETFPRRIKEILKDEEQTVIDNYKQSLFITGESGVGKTVEVYRRLLSWHRTSFSFAGVPSPTFWNVPKLLNHLRDLIQKPDEKNDLMYKLQKCSLLILDDIGAHNMTDWATECLYIIIDTRYEAMKTTWYVSNFDLERLAELADDDRLVRRIASDIDGNLLLFKK